MGHTRGYEILNDQETNRRHGHTNKSETRGQPRKLSKNQIDRMDEILQTWGLEGRSLTWNQLGAAAETSSISWRTIQRAMHERNYRKCLACTKTYVPKDLMIARKDWAWNKRNTYSLNDWKRVRFSDEVHFDEDLNEDYASFENLASVRVRIAYRNNMSLKRRTKNRNDIIVGLLWGGTSNQS